MLLGLSFLIHKMGEKSQLPQDSCGLILASTHLCLLNPSASFDSATEQHLARGDAQSRAPSSGTGVQGVGPSALTGVLGCSPWLQAAAPANPSNLDKYSRSALCHDLKTARQRH